MLEILVSASLFDMPQQHVTSTGAAGKRTRRHQRVYATAVRACCRLSLDVRCASVAPGGKVLKEAAVSRYGSGTGTKSKWKIFKIYTRTVLALLPVVWNDGIRMCKLPVPAPQIIYATFQQNSGGWGGGEERGGSNNNQICAKQSGHTQPSLSTFGRV